MSWPPTICFAQNCPSAQQLVWPKKICCAKKKFPPKNVCQKNMLPKILSLLSPFCPFQPFTFLSIHPFILLPFLPFHPLTLSHFKLSHVHTFKLSPIHLLTLLSFFPLTLSHFHTFIPSYFHTFTLSPFSSFHHFILQLHLHPFTLSLPLPFSPYKALQGWKPCIGSFIHSSIHSSPCITWSMYWPDSLLLQETNKQSDSGTCNTNLLARVPGGSRICHKILGAAPLLHRQGTTVCGGLHGSL